jgi:aminopeptidase N
MIRLRQNLNQWSRCVINTIKCLIFIIISLIPAVSRAVPRYNLSVEIDVRSLKVRGTAEVIPDGNQELIFNTGGLKILEINRETKSDKVNEIRVYGKKNEPIEIKYEGIFKSPSSSNMIDGDGVFLTGVWYPHLDILCIYNLTAKLPQGFESVSEAEGIRKVQEKGYVTFNFDFPHPLEHLHLIASDKFAVAEEIYKSTYIYTYFFNEDSYLSKKYIEYTEKYIRMYESLIGEFPYKRFVVVENPLPTGYSMPTFTLLGQSVIRLPFIVETSLGHEILHQWFGNYIYIDFDKGNWAEGLTTYLADHLYEELKGDGWQYRKNILIGYQSYVKPGKEFPLTEFRERVDSSSQSIGYGKCAMVFHMLKNTVGEQNFYKSLKDLIKEDGFRRVTWSDIKTAFERNYRENLDWFFDQWLNRKGLPELEIKKTNLKVDKGKLRLTFDILQKGGKYKLYFPISIYYLNGIRTQKVLSVSNEKESFTLYLENEPSRLVVDENYDVPRKLSESEFPPVVSRLLGEERIILVPPENKKDKYESLIKSFEEKKITVKTPEETKYEDIKSNSLVIFDKENPLISRLYGKLDMPDGGFSVVVKENPWNNDRVVAIVHGESKGEVELAYGKIFHYGKYSTLAFKNGNNIYKDISESERGISTGIRQPTKAVYIPSITNLEKLVEDIRDKKVVYVGEHHDEFAHHINQLNIIRELYKSNKKLAIGMEMFQRPFQRVINDYINGRIEEKEFLKRTEYFKRWKLDYNLYKPIVDFARQNRIPIIALNIDSGIVERVSRNGIDSLTEEEKKNLPSEIDFSDGEYKKRLREIFNQHSSLRQENFDFFFQAQILWDETMAESIDRFMHDNPDYQIVVLVGNGHISYGSGIPKRAFRRNGYRYSIVENDEDIEENIADYVLYTERLEGTTSPKLGVLLTDENGKIEVSGFTEDSVAKKSGLRKGDTILSFDNSPIQSIEDLKIALFYKEAGSVATIKILRDGGKEQLIKIRF